MPTLDSIAQSLASIIQASSSRQDIGSVETYTCKVLNVYSDSIGNVTSADVLLPGQQHPLPGVPNYSGIKLGQGDSVTLNFNRQNKHSPGIIQSGGGSASSAGANAAASLAAASAFGGSLTPESSSAPVALEGESAAFANGYVISAGSNIALMSTPPIIASGGSSNGILQIFCLFQRLTSLPNAATTSYPNGTLVELIDSYQNPLGLYQLVKSIPKWQLISGSGGGIFETDTFTGDGTTKAFTTSATPNGAVAVFYRPSAGDSFQRYDPSLVTVTGTTVTLTDSPIASSTILIDYTHS